MPQTQRHNNAVRVLTMKHAKKLSDLIEEARRERDRFVRLYCEDAIELLDDILELLW